MEDSWEHWLSHLGMGCHDGTTTTTSFEEIISLKGEFYDDGSNNNNNVDGEKEEKNKMKRGSVEKNDENEKRGRMKKGRSSSEAIDHIMSERKRRQEMAERFIALSATIPGLKKIDKASVLQEAVNYVKQLQQRISELEQEETNNNNNNMNKITKPLIVTKSHTSSLSSYETTNHDDDDDEEVVVVMAPEVEARELEKEILIRIHCEKRNGIMLKLLALLENKHLSVASSSILPFGNSALNIIIIAQMTEEFSLTVNDLVKTLKKYLMKFMRCNNNNNNS